MDGQPKEKKKGFFRRNKNKISKTMSICFNVLFTIGFTAVAILNIAVPPIAIGSSVVVSVLTIVFHLISDKYPEKLEEAKELFLKKLDSEDDRESVIKAFEEVVSKYSQETERTIRTEQNEPYEVTIEPSVPPTPQPTPPSINKTPSDKGDDEVEKMNAYYNKRTREYMITPRFPKK